MLSEGAYVGVVDISYQYLQLNLGFQANDFALKLQLQALQTLVGCLLLLPLRALLGEKGLLMYGAVA